MTERQENERRAELLAAVPDAAQRGAVEAWLVTRNAPRTTEEYEKDALVFVRWLAGRGPVDLAAIGEMDVTMFMAAQRATVSDRTGKPLTIRTVRRRVAVVSSLLKYLSRQRVRQGNPARDVDRPAAPTGGSTPVVTVEDVAAMWGRTAARDDVVIGLLYVSLMRVAELVSADVGSVITWQGQQVLRVRTKGSKVRDCALPPAILTPLMSYVGDRTEGALLVDDQGERLTRLDVVTALRRAASAAGMRNAAQVRPHMIRASGITHLLDAGVPIQDVQHLAGHEKPETTADYWRRSRGHVRDREVADILVSLTERKSA